MKLVKLDCIVRVLRAKDEVENGGTPEEVKPHAVWINPEDIQMVGTHHEDRTIVFIFFKNGESTCVAGTFEEVVEKLTTA